MGKARPLSDQELDRITQLHADGVSCTQIAKDLGRAKSTISAACERMGLVFDSTRTAAATDHQVQNHRQKRAALESRLLDEAGLLLDQLHQPHLVYNFGGKDNDYAERVHDEPDVQAKRTLVQAATTAITSAVKLSEVDKAGNGAEAGRSMVGALFAALAVTPVEEPAEPQE
jgi:hypothetical protein